MDGKENWGAEPVHLLKHPPPPSRTSVLKWGGRAQLTKVEPTLYMRSSKLFPYICCRILFTTAVFNLAELVALRKDLAGLHKILYFHENQLVYPKQEQKERDFQHGYNQILSWWVFRRSLDKKYFMFNNRREIFSMHQMFLLHTSHLDNTTKYFCLFSVWSQTKWSSTPSTTCSRFWTRLVISWRWSQIIDQRMSPMTSDPSARCYIFQ